MNERDRSFPEAFPWFRFLPQKTVQEFLVEFMETARAASDGSSKLTSPEAGDFGGVEPPEAPAD
ncbi:hypothetical protein [Streptomyces griseus]|uniref:hypothetical protein n=1 Tax=Streptomyces griseus TaxID=1911 RepID=UPI0008403ADC|nr:hypothetical protein [Streptomyces griseus]